MVKLPILMLSGMAADGRLFAAQVATFPDLRVVAWVEPLPGESLRAYAARLASAADPGRPCVVGGASFGGVVALEMARHLPAVACVLIGSVRAPSRLTWHWRALGPLAWLGPDVLSVVASALARAGKPFLPTRTVRRLRKMSRPEAAFVRWAACAVVRWRPSPSPPGVRVFQIHGSNDRVLPLWGSDADVVVPGGGHALSLFSPDDVNDFLAAVLRDITGPAAREVRTGHEL